MLTESSAADLLYHVVKQPRVIYRYFIISSECARTNTRDLARSIFDREKKRKKLITFFNLPHDK